MLGHNIESRRVVDIMPRVEAVDPHGNVVDLMGKNKVGQRNTLMAPNSPLAQRLSFSGTLPMPREIIDVGKKSGLTRESDVSEAAQLNARNAIASAEKQHAAMLLASVLKDPITHMPIPLNIHSGSGFLDAKQLINRRMSTLNTINTASQTQKGF